MKKRSLITWFSILLLAGFTMITLLPDEAEAQRFGGGSSVGSRGSRSFSTPRQATPRADAPQSTARSTTPAPTATQAPAGGFASRFGSGLLGGIGGFMLGGLLGSMLFGSGGGGGGFGLLEILLLGGILWFLWSRFKGSKSPQPMPDNSHNWKPVSLEKPLPETGFNNTTQYQGTELPKTFSMGSSAKADTINEVDQGLANIRSMDPNFNETQFLNGAKAAYQQIQGAWSDWSVDRLRPLLTDRMWSLIETQARQRQAAGRRDIVEKIRFQTTEITEAWQESGDDWLTVHFLVEMVEYETDVTGNLMHGNPNATVMAEEYWTFTRPVGSSNPNWYLSAIQQPDEVAKSVL
ncbi:MAG: Tim44 domain-containing protein [Magnetococcales bacterium]|nr:Tim44 domain-containing protein [Magnetococcales bacterium]